MTTDRSNSIYQNNSEGKKSQRTVSEINSPVGSWFSKVYNTANGNGEASGTIESLSVPAGAKEVHVEFKDLSGSVLTVLGVVIGAYTELEADTAITSLLAGGSEEAYQIDIGDILKVDFSPSETATIVAWKSTGADSGTNEVIVSWKV